MTPPTDDKAWFHAKRFGFGAGWPKTWQGYASIAAYIAVLVIVERFVMPDSELAAWSLAILATGVLLLVAYAKTEGGWKWRFGKDEDTW